MKMDISLFDNKIADLKEEYTNITQQQRTKLVELQNKIDYLEFYIIDSGIGR